MKANDNDTCSKSNIESIQHLNLLTEHRDSSYRLSINLNMVGLVCDDIGYDNYS